jgi:hypothetical protein
MRKGQEAAMNSGSRPPGQALTVAAFLAGALLLAAGLVFLCAAVQNTARFPIAFALLALGGGLAAWAGIRWRHARQLAPEVLEGRITDLAAAHGAKLTLAQVASELDVSDVAARNTLASLEARTLCHQERQGDRIVYVFPGLRESKVVRRCTYCGNEYAVREPLHKCPNCGGSLEITET